MRQHYENDTRKIYDTYTTIIKKVQAEIKKAYAQGLDDNDEYVQELQRQLWSAKDAQTKMMEQVKKEAEDSTEALVNIRLKMIKQDIQNQKDALKQQHDDYKEFINKQKELLREQYDEEDYLEEQKEKRKSVTDLQAQLEMLEVDDSAWAQKRKLEIQQKLTDAKKDLSDFERDYARDQAINELDDLGEIEDEKYNMQLAKLEEFENNAYLLRQIALADVRSGNAALYNEMIEWNRIYGDGVDKTITEAWTTAYKALQQYQLLYKQVYDNFQLANATGVKKNTDTWNKTVNPQNKKATVSVSTSKSTSSSSSTSKSRNNSSQSSGTSKGGNNKQTTPTSTPKAANTWSISITGLKSEDSKIKKSSGSGVGAKVSYSINANGGWNDYTGWAWMDGTPQKPEAVLNAEQAKEFKDFISILDDMNASGAMTSVYQSSDGARYRILSGGLLGGSLSDTAANYSNEILSKIFGNGFNASKFNGLHSLATPQNITMGDIIIQGNADQKTVSEIRREQRSAVDYMLRELNKLKS